MDRFVRAPGVFPPTASSLAILQPGRQHFQPQNRPVCRAERCTGPTRSIVLAGRQALVLRQKRALGIRKCVTRVSRGSFFSRCSYRRRSGFGVALLAQPVLTGALQRLETGVICSPQARRVAGFLFGSSSRDLASPRSRRPIGRGAEGHDLADVYRDRRRGTRQELLVAPGSLGSR